MGVQERRSREKGNRIQSILESARGLFLKKGFQNTSMEEIAQSAEIGKGTIYLYFKNKNDLYTSILVGGLENYRQRLMEIENNLDSGALNSTEEFVMDFFRMNYEAYNENPDSIFYQGYQLNQLLLNLSRENVDRLNAAGRKNLKLARGIVSKAIARNLLPELDPAQVIDAFRAMVLGNIQLGESRIIFAKKNYLKDNLKFSFSLLSKAFEALTASAASSDSNGNPRSASRLRVTENG